MVDGPDRGDIIQAEKAGILELSDVVVINKSDLPNAENTAKMLREGLELGEFPSPQIHLASALDGSGVPELVETLESIITHNNRQKIRIRELLLANWDSLLLNHPKMEQNLKKLCDGSKTITEAIQDMASTISLGGD